MCLHFFTKKKPVPICYYNFLGSLSFFFANFAFYKQVSEREDKLFNEHIETLNEQNAEVDGDADSEEEEDTGMGDIDLTNSGVNAD